mmetsp:Transcript_18013/g.44719  ORF Transcript_18013/g.44719 Transcript_18013/m.44719 type:complete len:1139 (-) Transcript_18013:362-3778(-)
MRLCEKEIERLGSLTLSQATTDLSGTEHLPVGTFSLEGNLFKTPDSQGSSGWKRRWFRLQGNLLFYYKERHDTTALGVVFLEDASVTYDGGAESKDVEMEKKGEGYGQRISALNESAASKGKEGIYPFAVGNKDSRSYKLSATTAEERRLWVNALRASSCQFVLSCYNRLQESNRVLKERIEQLEKGTNRGSKSTDSAAQKRSVKFAPHINGHGQNGEAEGRTHDGVSCPTSSSSGSDGEEEEEGGFSLVVDESGNDIEQLDADEALLETIQEVKGLERRKNAIKREIEELQVEEREALMRINVAKAEKKRLEEETKEGPQGREKKEENGESAPNLWQEGGENTEAWLKNAQPAVASLHSVLHVLRSLGLIERSDFGRFQSALAHFEGRVEEWITYFKEGESSAILQMWWILSLFVSLRMYMQDVSAQLPSSLSSLLVQQNGEREGSKDEGRVASRIPAFLVSMLGADKVMQGNHTAGDEVQDKLIEAVKEISIEKGLPSLEELKDSQSLKTLTSKIANEIRMTFIPYFKKSKAFSVLASLRDSMMNLSENGLDETGRSHFSTPRRAFAWPVSTFSKSAMVIERGWEQEREWQVSDANIKPALSVFAASFNMGAKDPLKRYTRSMIDQMLGKLLERKMDIYVVGVQECVADSFFEAIDEFLGVSYKRLILDSSQVNVYGRGDGSFVTSKYTGMMIWAEASCVRDIVVRSVGCQSFGVSEGSKGANFAVLSLQGTLFAFINCHLAAHIMEKRKKQVDTISSAVAKSVVGADSGLPLHSLCEHVMWMGDLNFRMETEDVETLLSHLATSNLYTLKEKYDTLTAEMRSRSVFDGYTEPKIDKNMFPSYKRVEGWPLLEAPDKSEVRAQWVKDAYVVYFQEPVYKGGRTKLRVPSWCDRVLYSSHYRRRQLLRVGSEEKGDNSSTVYRCVNDALNISDHCAIRCKFQLHLPPLQARSTRQSAVQAHIIHVFSFQLEKTDGTDMGVPKHVTVVFPLPSQCSDEGGVAAKARTRRRTMAFSDDRKGGGGMPAVYSDRDDIFDCPVERPTPHPHVQRYSGVEVNRGGFLRCDLPCSFDALQLLLKVVTAKGLEYYSFVSTSYIGEDLVRLSAPLCTPTGGTPAQDDYRVSFLARQVPFTPAWSHF